MSSARIKQVLDLDTILGTKSSQSDLQTLQASLEDLLNSISVDRITGETYLRYKTNPTSNNNVQFPASVNWKGGLHDIEVYVNSIKIPKDDFTYTQGTGGDGDSIVFNNVNIGYDVETDDVVEVVGVILQVVVSYPVAEVLPEPYESYITVVEPDFGTGTTGGTYNYAVVTDDDGYVYVGGDFTSYNGTTANRIVKLNPDGSINSAFNSGSGFNARVLRLHIGKTSGNLYVVGQFSTYNGSSTTSIIGLDKDTGAVNLSFSGTGATLGWFAYEQGDGKIMFAGGNNTVKRYNANGTTDNTFSFSSPNQYATFRLALPFANGKYLISGSDTTTRGVITDSSGNTDSTATANLGAPNNYMVAWVDSSNGAETQYIVGGYFTSYGSYSSRLMKVNQDGTYEVAFAQNVENTVGNQIFGMAKLNSDTYVAYGAFSSGREYPYNVSDDLFIFDEGGNKTLYGNPLEFSGFIWDGAVDSNGAILYVGSNSATINWETPAAAGVYSYVPNQGSARDLDISSFQSGFEGTVYSIDAYTDGKILIAGDLQSYNGTAITSNLVRLNSDGSLDSSFCPVDVDDVVRKVKYISKNDTILIGGDFTGYFKAFNGDNGSVNSDWTITFDGPVRDIYENKYKDKVVIGGSFTGGLKVASIYGTLDTSFNIGTGINTGSRVNAVYWSQRYQAIFALGNFTSYNGTSINHMMRLSTTGVLDTNFTTGSGFTGEPHCMMLNLYSNSFYVGGDFTSYKGYNAGNFALIYQNNGDSDADGTLNAWTRSGQFNGPVYSISVMNERTSTSTYNVVYYVGGNFTSYRIGEPGYGLKTVTATGVAKIGDGYWDIPAEWTEGVSTNGPVYAIHTSFDNIVDATGNKFKAFLGGDFSQYDGVSSGSIVQIDRTGTKEA